MKIFNSDKIEMSKEEWIHIGKQAGWNAPSSIDVNIELNGVKSVKSVPIPLGIDIKDSARMTSFVKGFFSQKGYEVGEVTFI